MGIKWQDKITNNEVLQRAKMDGMETMLMRAQLRWVLPRAANERQSNAETDFLFGDVLRRQK